MSVVIVGAGSAALHHAWACEELELDYSIAVRNRGTAAEFAARFRGRYGVFAQGSFVEMSRAEPGRQCDIGIVATPPMGHHDSVHYLHNMHPKVIFIEKPLAMPELTGERSRSSDARLLCGSHFVLRPSFVEFLLAASSLMRVEGVRIASSFCEPLRGPASAHSWDADFVNGWITDESLGGGVLSEYCHALFWVGWLHKMCGLPFPHVELDRYGVELNANSRASLVLAEMSLLSTTGVEGTALQSCKSEDSIKSMSVWSPEGAVALSLQGTAEVDRLTTKSPGGSIVGESLFPSNRGLDARRLITHLADVCSDPSLESPLTLEIATWVDRVVTQVRSVAFTGSSDQSRSAK